VIESPTAAEKTETESSSNNEDAQNVEDSADSTTEESVAEEAKS